MRCDLRLQVVLQPAFGKYISHYLFVRVVGLLEIVFRRGDFPFLDIEFGITQHTGHRNLV